MALTPPPFRTIKNTFLLQQIKAAAKKEYNDENFDFYFDKINNQALYAKYISEASPRQVNLPNSMRKPLDDLAAAKKWSAMNAGIKVARGEAAKLLDGETLRRLALTDEGQMVLGVAAMGLDGAKAKQALGLLTVYSKPRSPGDKYQAYLGLVKLSSKSKVDTVLKGMDMPPPAKPEADEKVVARNLKLDKLAKDLRVAIPKAMSYYESAIQSVKQRGLPADEGELRRMFDSGRMRHEKIHEAWGVAIRGDKEFTKKYKDVAALKEKLDDAWAEYRRLLKR